MTRNGEGERGRKGGTIKWVHWIRKGGLHGRRIEKMGERVKKRRNRNV